MGQWNGRVALWCGSTRYIYVEDDLSAEMGAFCNQEEAVEFVGVWGGLGEKGGRVREVLQGKGQEVDLAPWTRNEDSAWSVDI